MATIAGRQNRIGRDERFFLISAIIMTIILVGGFSLQLAAGRSSFRSPVPVHVHAVIFFGWTMLYLAQNVLVGRGYRQIHRTLGWLAVVFIPAMVVMGVFVTVAKVREGQAPFFFQPLYFLMMNPLSVLFFAGLATAAIVKRRQTQWHRRLMFCAMTILLGPGLGRLLPMPLLIPYAGIAVFAALMLFPIAGVIRDVRSNGRVHPAWWWGIGALVAMQALISVIAVSRPGLALYALMTADAPGAAVDPLAFPPFPGDAALPAPVRQR